MCECLWCVCVCEKTTLSPAHTYSIRAKRDCVCHGCQELSIRQTLDCRWLLVYDGPPQPKRSRSFPRDSQKHRTWASVDLAAPSKPAIASASAVALHWAASSCLFVTSHKFEQGLHIQSVLQFASNRLCPSDVALHWAASSCLFVTSHKFEQGSHSQSVLQFASNCLDPSDVALYWAASSCLFVTSHKFEQGSHSQSVLQFASNRLDPSDVALYWAASSYILTSDCTIHMLTPSY